MQPFISQCEKKDIFVSSPDSRNGRIRLRKLFWRTQRKEIRLNCHSLLQGLRYLNAAHLGSLVITPPSPWIYPYYLGPSTPITRTPFQHTYGIFHSWKPFHISQIPPLTPNALTAPPLPLDTCHTHPSPFLAPGNRLSPLLASYEIGDILLF